MNGDDRAREHRREADGNPPAFSSGVNRGFIADATPPEQGGDDAEMSNAKKEGTYPCCTPLLQPPPSNSKPAAPVPGVIDPIITEPANAVTAALAAHLAP